MKRAASPAEKLAKKVLAEQRAEFRAELAALNGVVVHVPPPVDPAEGDDIPASVRKAARERDGGCTQCPSHYELELNHRKLRKQGGRHDLANLITVCGGCHRDLHANPAKAYAQGLLVHSFADPARVPVWRRTSPGRGGRFLQGVDGSLTLAGSP